MIHGSVSTDASSSSKCCSLTQDTARAILSAGCGQLLKEWSYIYLLKTDLFRILYGKVLNHLLRLYYGKVLSHLFPLYYGKVLSHVLPIYYGKVLSHLLFSHETSREFALLRDGCVT